MTEQLGFRRCLAALPLFILSFCLVLAGCGNVAIAWREDVRLEDGRTIVVKRSAKGRKLGEIGGPGGWVATRMTLEIEQSSTQTGQPEWSERWVPMLLDFDAGKNEWIVVATFYTCEDWYSIGRPKLPYLEYRLRRGRWENVPLSPALIGKNANLLTSVRSSGEHARVTVEEKNRRDGLAADKYKKVLRSWDTNC